MVFYDKEAKKYFVYEPRQVVTGASVNWKDKEVEKLEKKHTLIAEFHSHVKMGTFFSGTDDKDENRGLIYGVISTKGAFECELRIKFGEKEYEVAFEDVIETPEVDWKKNIVTETKSNAIIVGGGEQNHFNFSRGGSNLVLVIGEGYFPSYMIEYISGTAKLMKQYDREDIHRQYGFTQGYNMFQGD